MRLALSSRRPLSFAADRRELVRAVADAARGTGAVRSADAVTSSGDGACSGRGDNARRARTVQRRLIPLTVIAVSVRGVAVVLLCRVAGRLYLHRPRRWLVSAPLNVRTGPSLHFTTTRRLQPSVAYSTSVQHSGTQHPALLRVSTALNPPGRCRCAVVRRWKSART